MRFSEREGYTKVRTELQSDTIDSALRNKLWNVLDFYYWGEANKRAKTSWDMIPLNMHPILNRLFNYHFKLPVDTIPNDWSGAYLKIREIYFRYEWAKIYDFIEFMANLPNNEETNKQIIKTFNKVLETEMSAFRFVGKAIVKINSEIEFESIEEASQSPFNNVNKHLENALKLMADRKKLMITEITI